MMHFGLLLLSVNHRSTNTVHEKTPYTLLKSSIPTCAKTTKQKQRRLVWRQQKDETTQQFSYFPVVDSMCELTTLSSLTDLSWPCDLTPPERWGVNTNSRTQQAPSIHRVQPICVKPELSNDANPCTLTEALDEADDTSPAPFSWHFHGAVTQRDEDTVDKMGRKWDGGGM